MKTKDLLDGPDGSESRLEILDFYESLVQGQIERIDVMRGCFFTMLQDQLKRWKPNQSPDKNEFASVLRIFTCLSRKSVHLFG